MERYTRFASWYDVMSLEPVYRAGRRAGIPLLHLRPGDRVLDVGCGTGLNFPQLQDAVGPAGEVVGVDRSADMLTVARRKSARGGLSRVVLLRQDATGLTAPALEQAGIGARFDAVLFTYSLSLMPHWQDAWSATLALLRDGGRACVVDMQLPVGHARALSPLARLACAMGGSDISAHPWRAVMRDLDQVQRRSARGGHVQVAAGTYDRTTR